MDLTAPSVGSERAGDSHKPRGT